ncbi:hypothetical protein C3B55_00564 [Candidatus Pseudomonas adelgestsugas]|uniref:Uncharacterized protein n=1 Tax=Candidatus Pseudomonas adelgestsugas TaxID=1302376 RepID=A0ABX5R8B9_9PSED|nr:hypothetical protein C3B55_00564 [Candidatus Pseudomonas adelgestsugas]
MLTVVVTGGLAGTAMFTVEIEVIQRNLTNSQVFRHYFYHISKVLVKISALKIRLIIKS